MTFRTRLFLIFSLAMLLAVALVATGVTLATRRNFRDADTRHTDALVAQFRNELEARRQEIVRTIEGIADAEATTRMALDLSRPQADVSIYYRDAGGVASSYHLDFLDFATDDGTIISSAEWQAHAGYKLDWVTQPEDWKARGAFLTRMETPDGPDLGLLSVSVVRVGDRPFYIFGGRRLDKNFLSSLSLPEGMRALLYRNLDPSFTPANLTDVSGPVAEAERFAPVIEKIQSGPRELKAAVRWSSDPASQESFHALPLPGRQNELLGVLLVGSSQRELVLLERRIQLLAAGVAAGGLLLGALLSWWFAARVTRPVQKLAQGARGVAAGDWGARVDVHSHDEIGQLARSFNQMTSQLVEQRERLVQAERVAAWREVARRLAHELKNPLFPLQLTIENLRRARDSSPEQFEEVFRESTDTLLQELGNLKQIIGRFSDFAKMPQPEPQAVNLNDVVRGAVKLFQAQFSAVGRPSVNPELHLDENLPVIQADPMLLRRAIENLLLNAMEAMPGGGVLMLKTSRRDGGVMLEVEDTGAGLTPEECQRLFTPYYTTKQHGTGLGLAIVQAVVSDHGGRISVESEAGVGTTFRIVLPAASPRRAAAAASGEAASA